MDKKRTLPSKEVFDTTSAVLKIDIRNILNEKDHQFINSCDVTVESSKVKQELVFSGKWSGIYKIVMYLESHYTSRSEVADGGAGTQIENFNKKTNRMDVNKKNCQTTENNLKKQPSSESEETHGKPLTAKEHHFASTELPNQDMSSFRTAARENLSVHQTVGQEPEKRSSKYNKTNLDFRADIDQNKPSVLNKTRPGAPGKIYDAMSRDHGMTAKSFSKIPTKNESWPDIKVDECKGAENSLYGVNRQQQTQQTTYEQAVNKASNTPKIVRHEVPSKKSGEVFTPPRTRRRKQANSLEGPEDKCTVCNIFKWLWYKNKYGGQLALMLDQNKCTLSEEPVKDDSIKITMESDPMKGKADKNECIAKLNYSVQNSLQMQNIFHKAVRWKDTSKLATIDCPKDTYICEDTNGGMVIVGKDNTNVQKLYDLLANSGHQDNSQHSILDITPAAYKVQQGHVSSRKPHLSKQYEKVSGAIYGDTPFKQSIQLNEENKHLLPNKLGIKPEPPIKGKRTRILAKSQTKMNAATDKRGASFLTAFGEKIHVFQGDITTLRVDAVANASNAHLIHGGGVARAINRAAGPGLQRECTDRIQKQGPLQTAEVYASVAYNMTCQRIMHVAGPIWADYKDKEQAALTLHAAFLHIMGEADRLNMRSIAIPAVSSAISGFPIPTVVQQMFRASTTFIAGCHGNSSVKDILFVDINIELIHSLIQQYQQVADKREISSIPAEFERFGSNSTHRTCGKPVETALGTSNYKMAAGNTMPASFNSQEGSERSSANNYHQGYTRRSVEKSYSTLSVSSSGSVKLTHTDSANNPTSRFTPTTIPADTLPAKGDVCTICMETPTHKVVLPTCKHVFCKECIDTWFKNKPTCPVCGQILGELKGDQPDGTMEINYLRSRLAGFEDSKGTLEIKYRFPGGMQKECHPNPGHWYRGTSRTAYLPNTEEGNQVLGLLRRAFDARLIFTIGRSTTTGREDTITWNDIHHKTKMWGGPDRFGYPDATYLSRVKSELAAKGIN